MARRVVAGIVGGALGVLPLVLVNLLVNAGGALGDVEAVAAQSALLLGIVALLGGVLAGGILAGWLAGRTGGAPAAGFAGTLAALLYAITVILVIVGGAKQGWGPSVAAIHPLRVSAAILLVACLLLGVALATGALVGRGRVVAPAYGPAPSERRPRSGLPSDPRNRPPNGPRRDLRSDPRNNPRQTLSGPRGDSRAAVSPTTARTRPASAERLPTSLAPDRPADRSDTRHHW